MSKQDYRKARKKAYELPRLAVGDVLLVGKFKNRKATITGFSSDENNQPVAQTDKGDQKIFKPRIAKLMPAKQVPDGVLRVGRSRQSRRWPGSWSGVQRAIKATTHEQKKENKTMSSIINTARSK